MGIFSRTAHPLINAVMINYEETGTLGSGKQKKES
jgi:hypothetical protein